uniref:SFRICE_012648 n=1 Tax=Spodoptera frugiperda TaxID=7108 RepID=A0A2H1X101_SPOFR
MSPHHQLLLPHSINLKKKISYGIHESMIVEYYCGCYNDMLIFLAGLSFEMIKQNLTWPQLSVALRCVAIKNMWKLLRQRNAAQRTKQTSNATLLIRRTVAARYERFLTSCDPITSHIDKMRYHRTITNLLTGKVRYQSPTKPVSVNMNMK